MTPQELDATLTVLRQHGVVAARIGPRGIQVAFGPRPTAPAPKEEAAKPDAPAVAIKPDGEGGLVAEVDPDLFAAV